jgi:hypothetical protein
MMSRARGKRPQNEAALFDLNLSGEFLITPIAPKALYAWKVIFGGKKRNESHLLPTLRAGGFVHGWYQPAMLAQRYWYCYPSNIARASP